MSSAVELDAPARPAPEGRPVVLLVDDEAEVLAALQRCLRNEPYELLSAGAAEEALGVLARRPVDLVVADQRLPGLCGADFLDEVRRRAPWAQRILLTGYPGEDRVRAGLGREIQELVAKPWDDEGLRRSLRALLREGEAAWPEPPDADRRELRTRLVEGQKLQTLGRLAAGIAHEINNPLGYILSNLATLGDYARELSRLLTFALSAAARLPEGDPEKALVRALSDELDARFLLEDFRKAVEESRQGAVRIRDLVRSLDAFARADDGPPAPVDLAAVVRNALRVAHNELKYRAAVRCELGTAPVVLGRARALEQVVVNLLVNAAQALDARGEVVVTASREDDAAVLRVLDTGPGLAPEHLDRLFRPFFTTKPGHVGLGLHVAARIVEAHRGRLEAEPKPGRGAAFAVRLPLPPRASEDRS